MTKCTNEIPELQNKLTQLIPQVRYAVCGQILSDCNYYVRVASHDMELSSFAKSDLLKGELVWDTPYAKRVYYYGNPSTTENPNASLMWCEKARSSFGNQWLDIVAKKLAEGLV